MSKQVSGLKNEDLTLSNVFNVKGYKAVVTGGGSGIGLMITQGLIANGVDVFITGRREEALKTVVETFSGKGSQNAGKITPIVGDVTSKDSIQSIVVAVSKACPDGIQLLVNNAGIAVENDTKMKNFKGEESDAEALSSFLFDNAQFENWQDTLQTNTTAHFFISTAFLPLLHKGLSKPGTCSSVINITSISGILKSSTGGQFAYGTSKAAANHLTKMLAQAFSKTKVRVNAIAPGVFPSEMTASTSGPDQKTDREDLGDMGSGNPAGRPGGETDITAAVLYLTSVGGNYVNGQIVPVDGGALLTSPSVM